MKRLVLTALLLMGIASTQAVQAAEITVLRDRFIIAFKGMTAAQRRETVEKMGGKVLRDLDLFGMVLASPGVKPAGVFKAQMGRLPSVVAIDNDFVTKWIEEAPAMNLADPRAPELVALRQEILRLKRELPRPGQEPPPQGDEPKTQGEVQWGVARVNAPAAWDTNQGDGVKVAVVDTGIDPTHPELTGKVAGGTNAVEKGGSWADDHFHGTHVAGIIAALLDGKGVVGVAPKAQLYAVKVLTKEGSGSMFGILEGMMWCSQNGMQVANMSLGAPQGNFLFEYGVQMMVNGGVTLVAAAGNGDGNGGPSPVNFPAAYKEAIAVSALSLQDGITKWSSRGPEVDFIAPGDKVPSSVPLWHDPTGIKAYSGTSMATPHVAGLAALAAAKGAKSPDAVRAALNAAAVKLPALSPDEQGAGVIDAAKLK